MEELNIKIAVKSSSNNLPIPSVNGMDLHSLSNPAKEAKNLIQRYESVLSGHNQILLFGLGFGYHLNQLEFKLKAKYNDNYKIYIIEPNRHIYQECLNRGLCNFCEKIKVFCEDSIDKYFTNREIIDFMTESPAVISHPESFKLNKLFFEKFMNYHAPTTVSSTADFIKNKKFQEYLLKNYKSHSIKEAVDFISTKKTDLEEWDLIVCAFKEIVNDTAGVKI